MREKKQLEIQQFQLPSGQTTSLTDEEKRSFQPDGTLIASSAHLSPFTGYAQPYGFLPPTAYQSFLSWPRDISPLDEQWWIWSERCPSRINIGEWNNWNEKNYICRISLSVGLFTIFSNGSFFSSDVDTS
ncbi:unnamed protein product [Onchocerca ochengi]|uniref:Uncharacterized protein n=1 Tax=Onchocerca ochengi TaxID=42157 RepID=A0A182ECG7_ONCOC|nr:unnamed protein product [Onchocerca ochengi]